jgi:hypothetical protein
MNDCRYQTLATVADSFGLVYDCSPFSNLCASTGGLCKEAALLTILRCTQYYGGVNAPYTFAHFPGKDSWEMFDEILTKCQVVTTPGVGFGPSGQGFIRISAFGARENVVEACARLKAHFKK